MGRNRRLYIYDKELGEMVEVTRGSKTKHHFIIDDTMDALYHPATGEMIDSKSKFREATKAAGCQEVGSENINPQRETKQVSNLGQDISEATRQLKREGKYYTKRTISEQLEYFEKRSKG